MRKRTGAVVLCAVMVSPAYGQEFQDGLFLRFLASKGVQEDLKLTPEQVKKVTEIRSKRMVTPPGFRDLTQEEREQVRRKLDKQYRDTLTKLLKPEQQKRLEQIWLQYRGPLACLNADGGKEMGLTDEQKIKVRSAQRELLDKLRALGPVVRDPAARKKRAEMESKIRKDTGDKVMSLLTPEQKTKWKELTGKPFDVEVLFFFPGSRPHGQPRPEPKTKTDS